ALLTVQTPPVITTQPQSQTVNAGSSVTFIGGATGTSPLIYQWRFNGTNISGAISSTYVIPNAQPAHEGNYTLVASNVVTVVTSTPALLTVQTPPVITTQPSGQTVNAGSNVTFIAAATGTAPLAYQWRLNGANISGATSSTYAIANAQPVHGGNYTLVVSNVVTVVTSTPALLTVQTHPVITTQPSSQTVNAGSSVTFIAAATGTAPLTYQWRLNGANISGAISSTYVIPNAQPAHEGNYTLVVSNVVTVVTSTPALLTVQTHPVITTQPSSQTVNAGSS